MTLGVPDGAPAALREPGRVERARRTVVEVLRPALDGRTTPLVVAFDGRSGVGKSTLAAAVAEELGGSVVHTDDFFSGGSNAEWAARNAETKIREVIDWQRLRTQVLEPLRAGRTASYRPANFATGAGLAANEVVVQPAALIVLDGAYSSGSELADDIDVSILVEAGDSVRRRRLLSREGAEYITDWHAVWDSAEDHYYASMRPRESFDLIVTTDE